MLLSTHTRCLTAPGRCALSVLPLASVFTLVALLTSSDRALAQATRSDEKTAKAEQDANAPSTSGQTKTGGRPRKRMRGPTDWTLYYYIGGGVAAAVIVGLYIRSRSRRDVPPPPAHTADVVGGYRLLNLMMTGQTSQVWEVVESSSGRHFAMKFLLPEKLADEECRGLLFHEAEVGIQLAHPNVIKIVKLARDPHLPYFVMEFFPAGNLKLRVMHKKWDFIKEHAHSIFKQTATALAYMNANGWVHRDVKPDNIMVNSAGEVRVIDFALAQKISKGKLFRRKGKTAGTRSYMSPEQIRGEPLDGRADVYSFGATCYEVITGRPPFRAATPQELLHKQIIEKPPSPQVHNAEVTDQFAALVLRMLAKKREDRPRDFHEVLMELRGLRVFKGEAARKETVA